MVKNGRQYNRLIYEETLVKKMGCAVFCAKKEEKAAVRLATLPIYCQCQGPEIFEIFDRTPNFYYEEDDTSPLWYYL